MSVRLSDNHLDSRVTMKWFMKSSARRQTAKWYYPAVERHRESRASFKDLNNKAEQNSIVELFLTDAIFAIYSR